MQLKMKSRAKILCMTLAMLLQRLPTLPLGKHLSTFFAPIAAHAKTLRALLPATAATTLPHALTGATTYVKANSENPASGSAGDSYSFEFYTLRHQAQSYLIQGLPDGLTFNGDIANPSISGTLPSAGEYQIQITGYRWANREGPSTSAYTLMLQIEEAKAASPWSHLTTDTFAAGFKSSQWFGDFYDNGDGWAYHLKHGWLFVSGADESALWMWDGQLGWLYTGSSLYPFFYRHSTSEWLYYKERENARQFWDYAKGTWTTYEKN
jgi:hypothetical protein